MKIRIERMLYRLKHLSSDTRGQSMVLVALSLVVLLGFGALATDVGYLLVQRRNAQNLADAASLAGTWYIGNENKSVNDVAKDYAELHGYSRENIEAEVVDNRYVEAYVTKNHDLFFARVLGFESSTVTARAKATRTAIWSLDTIPFAFQDWENLFYKIIEDDLSNKDNFYALFNDNKHEMNHEFNMRPGILEDDIRDLLFTSEVTSKLEVGQESVIYVEQGNTDFYDPYLDADPSYIENDNDKYPSWELEQLLQNNLSVYKRAFEKMAIEPNDNSDDSDDYEIDILFGKNGSITGNFGYAVPAKRGASAVADILTNGFHGEIGSVDGEPGAIANIAAEGGPLDLYLEISNQGFMYATLPKALKGGRWTALGPDSAGNLTEYLILFVYDLDLTFNPSDDTARLTGKVKEAYLNVNDIDKDIVTVDMYQSYLVKFD